MKDDIAVLKTYTLEMVLKIVITLINVVRNSLYGKLLSGREEYISRQYFKKVLYLFVC